MMANTARLVCVAGLISIAGCARETWPDPPPVDQATYEQDYKAWRDERQETLLFAVRILGIWPIEDGDTPFGSDPSLPIVLPARVAPARAGVFRRAGSKIEVVPAPGALLKHEGTTIKGPAAIETVTIGSTNLQVFGMDGESSERRFVSASDDDHPALKNLAPIETYPVDERWRVAARFDAFDAPRPIQIADVRGGSSQAMAPGELVFRLNDQEHRLLALGESGSDELFVMFRDPTNRSTTYGGYRILSPRSVANGQWTVIDFNFASNPPCAYSPYTTCPLPPPENRLEVAVEAGEKRHPTAQGFSAR